MINLVSPQQQWEPTVGLKLPKSNGSLDMLTETNIADKQFNRVVLNSDLDSAERPVLLYLEYASKSFSCSKLRKRTAIDIGQLLNYTSGHFKKELFVLPDYIIGNLVEVRLTTFTDGPGRHSLVVREAIIV